MVNSAALDPQNIDCKTVCVNGCVLGDQCPHRDSAKAAVDFIMNTDWDTLMDLAESKAASNPMAMIDNYKESSGT